MQSPIECQTDQNDVWLYGQKNHPVLQYLKNWRIAMQMNDQQGQFS
jgi:hypothetical protein